MNPLDLSFNFKAMLIDPMKMTAINFASNLLWYPVPHEPGVSYSPDGNVFDADWFARWMNPWAWNDPNHGSNNYNLKHLLTTTSTDDLLMRNGFYDPDGSGPTPQGLLTQNLPKFVPSGIAGDITYTNTLSPNDSALAMYPAVDLNYNPGPSPYNRANGVGDRSFLEIVDNGSTVTFHPKVPSALQVSGFNYGVIRDSNDNPLDPKHGKVQFALHSIGDINHPTQREIQTVQDYFTVMLRNVTNIAALGLSGAPTALQIDDAINDQAAQLTANFFDFADYDSAARPASVPNPVPGGSGGYDLPTRVVSRTGKVFYGIEKQPYISEVYWDKTGAVTGQYAIELTNPHGVSIDLSPVGSNPAYGLRNQTTGVVFWTFLAGNIVPAGGILYFANNYTGLPPASPPKGVDTLPGANPPWSSGDVIQLVRDYVPGTSEWIVLDEVVLKAHIGLPTEGFPSVGNTAGSLQRDNDPSHAGGWRVTVPMYHRSGGADGVIGTGGDDVHPEDNFVAINPNGHTIGAFNTGVKIDNPSVGFAVAPVHAMTDDMGLESAYPTTGSMLLLMRYANTTTASFNSNLIGSPVDRNGDGLITQADRDLQVQQVDNGHMPVFDTGQVAQKDWKGAAGAQPLDGSTLLNIPWGQLVFDYFTALPLTGNRFDPYRDATTLPPDPTAITDLSRFIHYLRVNQPTVRDGYIVEGRININDAPWKVLQGLPLFPPPLLPVYKQFLPDLVSYNNPFAFWFWSGLKEPDAGSVVGMGEFAFTFDTTVSPHYEQLGSRKALGIVAYRELRQEFDGANSAGDYNILPHGTTGTDVGHRERFDNLTNMINATSQRHTSGFVTVGELASVRSKGTSPDSGTTWPYNIGDAYQMDNGQAYGEVGEVPWNGPGYENKNYLFAVAPMVALGDWVTVKGNTFAAYGIVRGKSITNPPPAQKSTAVDERQIRFESVIDRSNVLLSTDPNEKPAVLYTKIETGK